MQAEKRRARDRRVRQHMLTKSNVPHAKAGAVTHPTKPTQKGYHKGAFGRIVLDHSKAQTSVALGVQQQ